MAERGLKNHPYIPNSVPEVQKEMLEYIGLSSLEDLHEDIPTELKLKEKMKMPERYTSEASLKRHLSGILKKNQTSEEYTSFLGGGCWNHYVPAVCDEINSRAEFLTAYGGEPYEDHGRFQALFEYQSLVAELVDMEVVNVPTFDWAQAAATSIRMAGRKTGRRIVLLPELMDPAKLMVIRNFISPQMEALEVSYEVETGRLDLRALEHILEKFQGTVAGIYLENPSYVGVLETQGESIARLAKKHGAEFIVGVDVSSLGVIEAPVNYGATITCGDLQPLGMHMNYGGGQAGFMATMDIPEYVMEYPSRLFGIAPTIKPGEYGFGDVAYDRTSFHDREKGKEYVGTQAALWGITAGVYLSLMGPKGMEELGETILKKASFAVELLAGSSILKGAGVRVKPFKGEIFKEFLVDFSATGKSVHEINQELLKYGIFGGKDLSMEIPKLGQCSLFAITELTELIQMKNLLAALEEILGGKKE